MVLAATIRRGTWVTADRGRHGSDEATHVMKRPTQMIGYGIRMQFGS